MVENLFKIIKTYVQRNSVNQYTSWTSLMIFFKHFVYFSSEHGFSDWLGITEDHSEKYEINYYGKNVLRIWLTRLVYVTAVHFMNLDLVGVITFKKTQT